MRHVTFAARCAAAVLTGLLATAAQATIVWSEVATPEHPVADPDLSNDGLAPTPVGFDIGTNTVRGTVGNPGTGVDRDYFKFVVPSGSRLTAIVPRPNTSVSGSSAFIAIQIGPQVTTTPGGGGIENLLGFMHYALDVIGTNILANLAPAYPEGLPSGTYSVWVQETGGIVGYEFDFEVASNVGSADVPLPLWTYVAFALVALARGVRKRKNAKVVPSR